MDTQTSINPIQQIIIIQKTPDYVKREAKKYYMKQKEEDPDFMKKKWKILKNGVKKIEKIIMKDKS